MRDGAWSGDGGVILVGGQRGRPLMRVSERGGHADARDNARIDPARHFPRLSRVPSRRPPLRLSRAWWRGTGRAHQLRRHTRLDATSAAARHPQRGEVTRPQAIAFFPATTLMAQAFGRTSPLIRRPVPGRRTGVGRTLPFSVSGTGPLAFIGGPANDVQLELVRFGVASRSIGWTTSGEPKTRASHPMVEPSLSTAAHRTTSGCSMWIGEEPLASSPIGLTTDRPCGRPMGRPWRFPPTAADPKVSMNASSVTYHCLVIRTDGPLSSQTGHAMAGISLSPPEGTFGRSRHSVTDKRSRSRPPPMFQELAATFSPDGRWIADQSDESTGITRSGEGTSSCDCSPARASSGRCHGRRICAALEHR